MIQQPGADELRIRATLIKQGVGPDAHTAATPPADPRLAVDPDGWWDDLYSEQPEEREPERQPAPRLPPWWDKKPTDLTHEADEEPTEDEPETAESDDEPDPEPDEKPADSEPEGKPAVPAEKTKVSPKKKPQKRAKKPQPGAPRAAWDTRPQSPRQSLIEAYDAVPYRLRWLAYHASAAYLGWSAGLVDYATYVTAWIADTGFGPQAWFWCGVGAATLLLHRRTRGLSWPVAWCAAVPAASTVVGVLLYAPTP